MIPFKRFVNLRESSENTLTFIFNDYLIPVSRNKYVQFKEFNPKLFKNSIVTCYSKKDGVYVTISNPYITKSQTIEISNIKQIMSSKSTLSLFLDSLNNVKKFWGKQGVGALIKSNDTGRYLLVQRADFNPKSRYNVQDSGTWAIPGGAIDDTESHSVAVLRELKEEIGYTDFINPHPELIYEYKNGDFSYFTYLLISETEFIPKLNWESKDYVWCTARTIPSPLHFGVKELLKHYTLGE